MEKKFTILIALMFIISAVIPLIIAQEPGDHITVEKRIVNGELYVPIETIVSWDLEIDVDTEDDLTNVIVLDGIGAEFDLVVNGDYIFKLDGVEMTGYTNTQQGSFSYMGMTVSWWQANKNGQGASKNKNKGCATVIMWDIGDLEDDDTWLEFTIVTKSWTTGNDRHTKQSFTSTCHHTLNDGPIVYYDIGVDHYWVQGDPITVSVYDPDPTADSDYDGLYDVDEVFTYETDPCAWDTDGDGFSDGEEVVAGTDPTDPENYPII